MNPTQNGDSLARLEQEVRQMREQLRAVSAALAAALDRQDTSLDRLERRVTASASRIQDILHSRIWRSLSAGGAILLKAAVHVRLLTGPFVHRWRAWQARGLKLQLDEAGQHPLRPDELVVRGWALSTAGVDRVEVQLEDGVTRLARLGTERPDVGRAFPQIAGAWQSGFELEIPCPQASRPQRVRVRAVSRAGAVRETEGTVGVRRRSTAYGCWIDSYERGDENRIRLGVQSFARKPLVSILMPVYRPSPAALKEAIASVRAQSYSYWELCLADDASGEGDLARVLEGAAASDQRIRLVRLERHGGIAAATNAALAAASGEYVGLLDQDDALAPDALYHVVEAINRQSEADLLYSDEDKIDEAGVRHDPFFKPDWSPDLLRSENYICHFLVARRQLVLRAGGLRSEYDGAQDYDLVLRLVERTSAIVHLPRVLYHWRAAEGSTARDPEAKPGAADAAARALGDHLGRIGVAAIVEPGCGPGRLRVRYAIPPSSRVSILIPAGGNIAALRTCLDSVTAKTAYPDYEILVIDNSKGGRVERLVRSGDHHGRTVRYLDWRHKPFNYSALNNAGARECDSPLLVFLNDDADVIEPHWLEAMVEMGVREEVGAVGAKLLYPDGRIQHAGVVLGLFETCGHAFRGLDGAAHHYFDFPDVIRNVSAVTAACMLVRASVFWQAGGFDESWFPVAFNDVDLCLRIGRLGYRVLYTPYALLYHWESRTRDFRTPMHDRWADGIHLFWADAVAADPFYTPHLTRTAEDYSLRT